MQKRLLPITLFAFLFLCCTDLYAGIMDGLVSLNQGLLLINTYITPKTHLSLLQVMVVVMITLILMGAGLAAQWFRQLHMAPAPLQYFRMAVATINVLLAIYIMVLLNEQEAYYAPAPYTRAGRGWLNLLSYMPFVLVIGLGATAFLSMKKRIPFGRGGKEFYSINMIIWVFACCAFAYWGFYNVF